VPILAIAADGTIPDDVVVQSNIAYSDVSPACTLDLAMPKAPATAPRPAIVVIHGGGWLAGSRRSFSYPPKQPPGKTFGPAHLGYVGVTMDYGLSGEATSPAGLDDCRCAVRWLRAHSAEFGVDPKRIGGWGNSAGGHLALMLGLAPEPPLPEDAPFREHSSRV